MHRSKCKTVEEFSDAAMHPHKPHRSPPGYPLQRAKSFKSFASLSDISNENHASRNDNLWDDFEFVAEDRLKRKSSSRNSLETDTTENPDENQLEINKTLITKKIMVIGQRGSGKHYLVNSAFHSEDNQSSLSVTQTMDFMLKTEADEVLETKYHFWIRELNEHKFDDLVKVYYKIISVFVFVYSTNDRNSFEALNEAIESVKKEIPNEKFVGVLLANSSENNKEGCEVSHAEGIALKEQHNLAFFLDSNEGEAIIKSQLLHVLNK